MISKKFLLIIGLLVGVVFVIPPISVAQEIDLECPKNEVVVVRTTNLNPICVDESTALKWVSYGMATIVEEPSEEMEEEIAEETVESTTQKISEGVTPENPLCKNYMQLILKINNNKPLCVKPTTAEKLIQRDNFSNLKTYFITYEVYNGFTGPLVCDSGDFAISGGSEGGTSDIANMRMLHQLPDRVVFSSSDQDDDFHLFIYAYCADISEPFR